MSLFTPKMTPIERQRLTAMMKQLGDSAKLVESTENADVFFERLNFMLDLCLELSTFEKYKCFSGLIPSVAYREALNSLDEVVDRFITRSCAKQQVKSAKLKTDSGKQKSNDKFAADLKKAFDNANSFWTGHTGWQHYTGALFSKRNYARVEAIYNDRHL